MEREELKEAIVRDLNSESYPFIVEVRGNTIIGRWKRESFPENAEEKNLRAFSVEYRLHKNGTFSGGETTVHIKNYTPPMTTETRTVYGVTTPDHLPWRKKVAPKDWAAIGYDTEKLFSIMEHYLIEHGFSYRPGIWNHAHISWEAGYQLRMAGALFLIVGFFLAISFLNSSIYRDASRLITEHGDWAIAGIVLLSMAVLLPIILMVCGTLLLLIGFGRMDLYELRRDIAVKAIFGTIIMGWMLIFAFMIIAVYR